MYESDIIIMQLKVHVAKKAMHQTKHAKVHFSVNLLHTSQKYIGDTLK